MTTPSKTIMDLLKQPSAKRLKRLPSSPPKTAQFPSVFSSKSTSAATDGDDNIKSSNDVARSESQNSSIPPNADNNLTAEHKSRMEFNRALARAKRNLKLCSDKLSKCGSLGNVKLEELLVEETWQEKLSGEFHKSYAQNLFKFVESEIQRNDAPIYPPQHLIFNALNTTSFDVVKVVIIGQDPYHGPGQAMGLSFSVPEGVKVPSSLINIYKELQQDLGCSIPKHGNLERWALQGVLLLNAVLTVKHHQANSHANKGWEQFTDAVIKTISKEKSGVVFLLWGNYAQAKARLIDETKHCILKSAHPSGLSANRGFFGCRHFSKTNQTLEKTGVSPINWQL